MWLADPDAFSQAIEQLYNAHGLRRRLGEAGIEHVRKSFDWDVAAARFHKYITGLAAGGTDSSEA
jgi:glycosyltransferase involved in cell wall biosynthesis